jgi:hypothetical protein
MSLNVWKTHKSLLNWKLFDIWHGVLDIARILLSKNIKKSCSVTMKIENFFGPHQF